MGDHDERAIERLLYRYAACVDDADWEALGQLFWHGAVTTEGSDTVAVGPQAVSDLWRTVNRVHPDGTLRTQHLITNVVVDVAADGQSARADSYFMVFQATDALPLQPIAGGRYDDTFRKVDGQWCFELKTIRVRLVGELSEHLSLSLTSDGQLSEPASAELLALVEDAPSQSESADHGHR